MSKIKTIYKDFIFSNHAIQRMRQRGIKKEDIFFVLEKGVSRYSKDSIFFYIPKTVNVNNHKIKNLLVITSHDLIIKTFIKNEDISKIIRKNTNDRSHKLLRA